MDNLQSQNTQILSLSLDGFEGTIDLLLSLARDHKIDLAKLSILKLAEQYLEFLDKIISTIPVGRLGHPQEIARAVAFLAREDSQFVTGSTISINGGHHMY